MKPSIDLPSEFLSRYRSLLREFARRAEAFLHNVSELSQSTVDVLSPLEGRIADSARSARISGSGLTDMFESLPCGTVPSSLKQEVDFFSDKIDELLGRWGWSPVLTENGAEWITTRIDDHHREKRTPLLRQALAWRRMKGIDRHQNGDALADEARKLSLEPAVLAPGTTVEEAAKRTWALHHEWRTSSALGKDRPVIDARDYAKLREQVYQIGREAARVGDADVKAAVASGTDVKAPPSLVPANVDVKPVVPIKCSKAELLRALNKHETNTKHLGQLVNAGRMKMSAVAKPVGHARYEVRFTDPEEHIAINEKIKVDRLKK